VTGDFERGKILHPPGKEPTERCHDVLARLDDAQHFIRSREQRAVEHAVGIERQERLSVTACSHA